MFKKFTWNTFKQYWGFVSIAVFYAIVIIYVGIQGENTYLQIHDFLDSHPAWMKMMKDNGIFFNADIKLPMLHGLPRDYMYSNFKAYTWLIMIFPTFYAIVMGWLLKILISITGFLWLANICIKSNHKDKNIAVMCGFMYGIAPTFPPCDFEFASLPMILALLISICRKFKWKYLIGLLCIPVISGFAMFGIFVCGYVFLWFLCDFLYHKKPTWRILLAALALSIGYVITEWRLFFLMLFSGEITLRKNMVISYISFPGAMKQFLSGFYASMYHCSDLHKYIVFPVCMSYFCFKNFTYAYMKDFISMVHDKFNWLIGILVINSLFYGFDYTYYFRSIISMLIPPLTGFSFSRTLWLNGALWYFAFMIVLMKLPINFLRVFLVVCGIGVLCFKPDYYNHIYANIVPRVHEIYTGRPYTGMFSYKEFYSTDLFERIKQDIGYKGEWSIAFAMHPSIIEYNGIATLDGYCSFYSQSYKEQFRKLILPDLLIDKKNQKYFDNWGGRAYIFSDEIEYAPERKLSKTEANMLIDMDVFKDMGGKYVFSRVKIKNAKSLGLSLAGVYSDGESPYTIYVYRLSS